MSKDINNELLNYVSNVDMDVYSVRNLPEEVIAVIFAYVSRSPKSFRENLLKVTEEKASNFHEKWVLNFGHASVAELAVIHMCIEKVSRLFSSILERANLFISPIEYSQRYQKPKPGDFYIPPELNDLPNIKKDYIEFNNHAYDVYEELNKDLFQYHINHNNKEEGESEKAFKQRWEKIAFEDARYVLPLSVYTNLGFTANGRALENLIMKLLSSNYPEIRTKAEQIKKEARKVLPTLVKYANENDYIKAHHEINLLDINLEEEKPGNINEDVNLVSCDYPDSEKSALISLLSSIISAQRGINQVNIKKHLESITKSELVKLFKDITNVMGLYDEPWDEFHQIRYNFQLYISEACWHQLLRHRKCEFYYSEPNVHNGLTIPESIKKAGIENKVYKIANESKNLYEKFDKIKGYEYIKSYTVINAHKRRVTAIIDLWEMYNIINLRLTPHAQWDIKSIIHLMTDKIKEVHPNLISKALDRVKSKNIK
jgi:thymidylate synthase ThyX